MPLLALYAGSRDKPARSGPTSSSRISSTATTSGRSRGTPSAASPPKERFPNQQPVTGFKGKGLVNSYIGDDNATGKLISQPFTIKRNFIRFLIGGGAHPNTQIRLIVAGKVVRASSGHNEERLTARALGRPRVRRQEGPHRDRR